MDEIAENIQKLRDETIELKNLLHIMKLSLVRYHKSATKKIICLEKKIEKKKQKKMKNPSGFARPTEISQELCEFMNKPCGSKIPRTEVTKYLINYIKENKLQDEAKKSNILPDNKLKVLLGKNEGVTYFSLQTLMNRHFVKYKNVETQLVME